MTVRSESWIWLCQLQDCRSCEKGNWGAKWTATAEQNYQGWIGSCMPPGGGILLWLALAPVHNLSAQLQFAVMCCGIHLSWSGLTGWSQTWKLCNTRAIFSESGKLGIIREFRTTSGKNCNKRNSVTTHQMQFPGCKNALKIIYSCEPLWTLLGSLHCSSSTIIFWLR